MCFRYLNKFFGGSSRRRNNAAASTDNASPRSSLPTVRQVSVDTVRTTKSTTKSIKSGNGGAVASRGTVNVGNQLASSVNSMRQAGAAGAAAGGGALNESATNPSLAASAGPASSGPQAADNTRSGTRSSWWGYFGMNKKKKSSIESL